MPVHPFVLATIPAALFALCAVLFFRRADRTGFLGFARALGFLGLCCLPAAVIQSVGLTFLKSEPFALVLTPISWFVLTGGFSVIAFFSQTARDVTGHRESVMLDNWAYFTVLTTLQLFFLAFAIQQRWKDGAERGDPVLRGVTIFVIANSLIGLPFPWWGT